MVDMTFEDIENYFYNFFGFTTGALEDNKRDFYIAMLGGGGALTTADLEWSFLSSITADSTLEIDDQWFAFLNPLYGPGKAIQDLRYEFYSSVYSPSMTFTMIHNDLGNMNWISLPLTIPGIADTEDLSNAIATAWELVYVPVDGDVIEISILDPVFQTHMVTNSIYMGGVWIWLGPTLPVTVGEMFRVSVFFFSKLPGETRSFPLVLTGTQPAAGSIHYTLYYTLAGDTNEVQRPWYDTTLTGSTAVLNDITSLMVPADGDAVVVSTWDNVNQVALTKSLTRIVGVWTPDANPDQTIAIGQPFRVNLTKAGGVPYSLVWM